MSLKNARRLRRDLTHAERELWSKLRNRRLDGEKFRRQHPLGKYVLDYCEERRLAIELDGPHHTPEGDAPRTAWLEAHGCHVLRFDNLEVVNQLSEVLETICKTLRELPSRKG
jgi:very-short-patch-repair endonuclease